jgi:hypothetical protein
MIIVAAAVAALAAWATFGALAVVGPGAFTARVGLVPSWTILGLLILLAAAVLIPQSASRRDRAVVLATFLALILLPWVPLPVPRAFLVWTGPVTAGIWAGVVAANVATHTWKWRVRFPVLADPRRAPWIAAAASAAFFGIVAAGAAPMVPGGDEPHYLIVTQSLLSDGDLQIENNHARRDYAPYFDGALKPDYLMRGKNGAIYSIHSPGLPALIAPFFAIGGYHAVVLFLIVLSAAGVGLLWKLAHLASADPGAAWFGVCTTSCATPVAFHSFTIYPDSPAWVIALTAVLAMMRLDARAGAGTGRRGDASWIWALHGAALALLPWIHSRFAWLAACFGFFILWRLVKARDVRPAVWFLSIPFASAVAWFWSFYAIYGTPNPQAPYGTLGRTHAAWAFVPDGLLGVLFDQQFGLFVYAPVFFVVVGGWLASLRNRSPNRRLAIEIAILTVPYLISVTYLRMWWGGWSVPVRFTVPVLMLGGIFAAIAWRRMTERGTRAASVAALLVTAFTTLMLAFVERGQLAFNVRDGVALWLEWLSPLADLPRGFPSFFRGPMASLALHAAVWMAALGIAWLVLRQIGRDRLRGRAALASATALTFALAAMAALTVVWRLDRAPGVTPAPAQLALIRAAAAGRSVGIRPFPPAITSADTIVSSLRIASPERALGGSRERPAVAVLGLIPAGSYDILGRHADLRLRIVRPDELRLRIVRPDEPIFTLEPNETTIRLPVDVPALIGHGSSPAPGDALLVLRASMISPLFDDRPRARAARRYGRTVVYFLDDEAFAESDAFWIGGASTTEVVVQPDGGGGEATIFLRNAPVENSLLLSSGSWRDERKLTPGEEREITIPLDTSRGATRLRLHSASGFRPSELDRRSPDSRFLGVWIQFRD